MTNRIRRRSAAIGLTALSLTGGLVACGEPATDTPMKVYATADACQQSGQDWNTCNTSLQQAQAEHLRTAPQFASREDCRRQTGEDCDEHAMSDGSHSVFLPLMAGFMLGQMMGGRGFVSHPVYYGQGGGLYSGQTPVSPRDDRRQASGGAGGATGRALPSEVRAPLNAKGSVSSVTRGGFGRTSSAHGGAGE